MQDIPSHNERAAWTKPFPTRQLAQAVTLQRISTALAPLVPLARKAIGLSGLTAAGQLTFVIALPILSRQFTPTEFGLFTIYLSIVNICGPLVGLKFESALYATRSHEDARLVLGLSFYTIFSMTLVAIGLLMFAGPRIFLTLGGETKYFVLLVPAGIFLAGTWAASTAWAVKSGAIASLSMARFLQPALMTALQLIAGIIGMSGIALIIAHLVSHVAYTTFIFTRTLTLRDVRVIFALSPMTIMRHARDNVKFPLFVLPANLGTLAASNLPPVLIGWVFGTAMAGYYGMAYRIISAPLTMISVPLGNVFTSEASRDLSLAHLWRLGRTTILLSLCFVSIPTLAFSMFAPRLAGWLLGPSWIVTGEIASALAIMGAAQALTVPFSELTSIYHCQSLRILAELPSVILVFLLFAVGAAGSWSAISTIWLMAAGGGCGSIIGFSAVSVILRRRLLAQIAYP